VKIDILALSPQASNQRKFLPVIVDYFTKRVEVELVATISENKVIDFLWKDVITKI